MIENAGTFLKEKYPDLEGFLFLKEKYLDKLPDDYFEVVSFIFLDGIKEELPQRFMVSMDEPESTKFFKLLALDNIPIYILSDREIDGKKVMWNMMLTRAPCDKDKDPEKCFVGGENLRKFCDDRNLFYQSMKTPDGELISSSNLKWLKKDNEDCRVPMNELEK